MMLKILMIEFDEGVRWLVDDYDLPERCLKFLMIEIA